MRALWVTAIPPAFEREGGGNIRQAHLLKALAGDFEVDLILAGELRDERIRGFVASLAEVPISGAPEPRSPLARRFRDLQRALVDRVPGEVFQAKLVRAALAPMIAAHRPVDLVCVEYIGLAPLLPRRRSAIWAITLHNLTSGMARQSAAFAPGLRQRAMLALEERNSRRAEAAAARDYDICFAVSEEDARELPGDVEVVPNGVDAIRFSPTPLPAEPRLIFTGALHTLPNRDGIAWFGEHVWPLVRVAAPGATLEIVGARPPAEVARLGRLEGVSVAADVAAIEPYLKRSRVAIVPLRIGTGSRLKALEAMASGRPVVGTRAGLGGLEIEPGRHALTADDPRSFAGAIVSCLEDDVLATGLAERGRALATARYGWDAIGAHYLEVLREALAGR